MTSAFLWYPQLFELYLYIVVTLSGGIHGN